MRNKNLIVASTLVAALGSGCAETYDGLHIVDDIDDCRGEETNVVPTYDATSPDYKRHLDPYELLELQLEAAADHSYGNQYFVGIGKLVCNLEGDTDGLVSVDVTESRQVLTQEGIRFSRDILNETIEE